MGLFITSIKLLIISSTKMIILRLHQTWLYKRPTFVHLGQDELIKRPMGVKYRLYIFIYTYYIQHIVFSFVAEVTKALKKHMCHLEEKMDVLWDLRRLGGVRTGAPIHA